MTVIRLRSPVSEVITSLAWLDATTVMGISRDGILMTWDITTGRLLSQLIGPSPGVFSRDAGLLVSVDPQIGLSVSKSTDAHRTFVRVWDVRTKQPGSTSVALPAGAWFAVAPDGDVQGSEGFADQLVYVVDIDGLTIFTPAEFARRFGRE